MGAWLSQEKRSRNDLMKAASRIEAEIYKAICPFANMHHATAQMLRNWGFDVSLGGATEIPDDHVLSVFVYAEEDEIKMRLRFHPEGDVCDTLS